jgi:hypothetical protein
MLVFSEGLELVQIMDSFSSIDIFPLRNCGEVCSDTRAFGTTMRPVQDTPRATT